MSFEQEDDRDGQKSSEEFWLHFVHIVPRPDQQDLIEGLRNLCPWIKQGGDGYTVETGFLSDAAWEYLTTHQIAFAKEVVPKDPD